MVALATEKGIELSFEEALRWIPHRLTKMRSHSFYRYFHHLKMLSWVEPTGEEEGSLFGGVPGATVERTTEGTTVVEVPQPQRFHRLTAKGKEAPDVAWSDPCKRSTTIPAKSAVPGRRSGYTTPAVCPAQQRPGHAQNSPPQPQKTAIAPFFAPRRHKISPSSAKSRQKSHSECSST